MIIGAGKRGIIDYSKPIGRKNEVDESCILTKKGSIFTSGILPEYVSEELSWEALWKIKEGKELQKLVYSTFRIGISEIDKKK